MSGARPDAGTWLVRAGACFLLAAPVSVGRALLTGTLAVERTSFPTWFLTFLLLAPALVGGTACVLRAWAEADRTPWLRLVGGLVALHVLAWPVLPITSNDVFSNLAYGRMAARGLDPGRLGPASLGPGDPLGALVTPRWREAPSPYGPLVTEVARWSAGGSSVLGALVRFKLAMLVVSLAVAAVALAVGRRWPGPDGRRRALLVAASPLLVWEVTSQAHNDGLLVLALAGVAWAAVTERPWVALACAVGGVVAKGAALPALVLLLVVMLRERRTRLPLLTVTAAAVLVGAIRAREAVAAVARGPLLASGALDVERHTRSVADVVVLCLGFAGPRVQAVTYHAFWAAHVVVTAAVLAAMAWRSRTLQDALHGCLVTLLVYLWTTPWAQPWYGTWLLPLLAVERDESLRRAASAYVVLLAVQWALVLDPATYLVVNGVPWWMLWRARAGRPIALPSAASV